MNQLGAFLEGRKFLEEHRFQARGIEKANVCGVTEMGAHSMKFHHFTSHEMQTVKHAYALGHEVYTMGRISDATARKILELFSLHGVDGTVAIGTSAVRDAENRHGFVNFLQAKLGITVHILSSWEEATLLAAGYLAESQDLPALVFDLGGGSTEYVYLNRSKSILWDSIPVGAIRSYLKEIYYGPTVQMHWVERKFRKALLVHSSEIFVTGGTAKAISKALKKTSFSREDLEDLSVRVRLQGPPRELKPERALVFLPGLYLLLKIMDFVEAKKVTYFKISVGQMYLSLAQNGIPGSRTEMSHLAAS